MNFVCAAVATSPRLRSRVMRILFAPVLTLQGCLRCKGQDAAHTRGYLDRFDRWAWGRWLVSAGLLEAAGKPRLASRAPRARTIAWQERRESAIYPRLARRSATSATAGRSGGRGSLAEVVGA